MCKENFVQDYLVSTRLFVLNTLSNALSSNVNNLLELNNDGLVASYKGLNSLLRGYNENRDAILSTTISPFIVLLFDTITKVMREQNQEIDNFTKFSHIIFDLNSERVYADLSKSTFDLDTKNRAVKFLNIDDEIENYFDNLVGKYTTEMLSIAKDCLIEYSQKIEKTKSLNNDYISELKKISKNDYALLINDMLFLAYFLNQ